MTKEMTLGVCTLTTLLAANSAFAHGFRLPDQDAKATARGEAFAATADNASAIYYNPAGIGMLPGHNARVGLFAIDLNVEYESSSGAKSETDNNLEAVPHVFYSYGMEDLPLALGIGFYSPYGLKNEWSEDTGFRSIALSSKMTYMTVNPVIAWRVLPNLSLAAGPTINYSEIKLKSGVTPFPGNDVSRLKGDDTQAGFNLGVLYQPHEKISLGASYRSQTKMNYEGDTDLSFVVPPPGFPPSMRMDAEAEVTFPQNVVLGISYRPTPEWNFEFDVDWTDWDHLNTVQIDQAIPASLPLNWESSIYYEFGVTRYLGEHWQISAGYIFNENSVPDETFHPWVPDQDRHFACFGAGYRCGHFSIDAAYQFGYGPSRTVTGSPVSAAGQSADGKYEYTSHAFAVTAGFTF